MPVSYNRFQKAMLLLCIIFSVVSAVIFAYQVYTFISRGSTMAPPIEAPVRPQPQDDFLRGVSHDSPIVLVYSFFGMIISALAGVAIYSQSKMKEKEGATHSTHAVKLQPDGREVVKLLQDNGGTLTQSELVKKSGMNKLRVSRIIKRLEKLNVIQKHPYGMTNNITLEQGKQAE